MGVNAFNKPSALIDYTPIPFKNIAYMGDKARAASNLAGEMAIENAAFNVDALEQDDLANREGMGEINDMIKELPALHEQSGHLALKKSQEIAARQAAYANSGQGSYYKKSKETYDANMQAIEDSNLTESQKVNRKAAVKRGFKGTKQDEYGTWKTFKNQSSATIDKQVEDQAVEFARHAKASQTASGIKLETDSPFYKYTTNGFIKEEDLKEMMREQLDNPSNRNHFNQIYRDELEAEGYTDGFAPNSNGNMVPIEDVIKERGDTHIENAIAGSSKAFSFNKETAGYKQDSVRIAKEKARIAAKAVVPIKETDAHYTHGATEVEAADAVPPKYYDKTFDEAGGVTNASPIPTLDFGKSGNLTQQAMDQHEKAMEKWNADNKVKSTRQEQELYADAESFGMSMTVKNADGTLRNRTPQELNEEISNAYIDYSTKGTVTRGIQDQPTRIRHGNTVAAALDNIDMKITEEGTMNPSSMSVDDITMEMEGLMGFASKRQVADMKAKMKEQLRKEGISGTTDKGEPYFNYEGRSFIVEPIDEVKTVTKPYRKMLEKMDNHESGYYTDPASGISFQYDNDIIDGKFGEDVRVLLPGATAPITMDMKWLASQTEEQLETENLIKTLKLKANLTTSQIGGEAPYIPSPSKKN